MAYWYYLGPWQQSTDDGVTCFDAPETAVGLVDLRAPETGKGLGFFVTSAQLKDSSYELVGTQLDGNLTSQLRSAWRSLTGLRTLSATTIIDALWETLTVRADHEGAEGPRPLTPTHHGVLELHLGDHGLVKSKRFHRDAPEWPVIQRAIQADYRKVYDRNPDLAGKVLAAWQRKYRGVARAEFLPQDRPAPPIRKPETTITDNFNRPNQTGLGTSAEGWSWTLLTPSELAHIASNRARMTGDGGEVRTNVICRAEFDLSSDDHETSAVITGAQPAPGAGGAVYCRFSASSITAYVAGGRLDATAVGKLLGGTLTGVGPGGSPVTNGARIALKVDGSTLTYSEDGVQKIQVSDSSITGNLRTGLGGKNGALFDDFIASDLLGIIPIVHHRRRMMECA